MFPNHQKSKRQLEKASYARSIRPHQSRHIQTNLPVTAILLLVVPLPRRYQLQVLHVERWALSLLADITEYQLMEEIH